MQQGRNSLRTGGLTKATKVIDRACRPQLSVTVGPLQRPCGQVVVNCGTSAISEQVRAVRGALLKTAVGLYPPRVRISRPPLEIDLVKAPDQRTRCGTLAEVALGGRVCAWGANIVGRALKQVNLNAGGYVHA